MIKRSGLHKERNVDEDCVGCSPVMKMTTPLDREQLRMKEVW